MNLSHLGRNFLADPWWFNNSCFFVLKTKIWLFRYGELFILYGGLSYKRWTKDPAMNQAVFHCQFCTLDINLNHTHHWTLSVFVRKRRQCLFGFQIVSTYTKLYFIITSFLQGLCCIGWWNKVLFVVFAPGKRCEVLNQWKFQVHFLGGPKFWRNLWTKNFLKDSWATKIRGIEGTPPKATPPRNKALITPY